MILGFLDAIRHGQEQVLGDLSMTLCDPFAINFLASSAIKIINHQVTNEALPRENAILHLLLRMMGLGLSAWDMIDTQEFMEPKLNTGLITKFVPSLMSLVVDDQIRQEFLNYLNYRLMKNYGNPNKRFCKFLSISVQLFCPRNL